MGNYQSICGGERTTPGEGELNYRDNKENVNVYNITPFEERKETMGREQPKISKAAKEDNKSRLDNILPSFGQYVTLEETEKAILPSIKEMSLRKPLSLRPDAPTSGLIQAEPIRLNSCGKIYHGQWNDKGEREGFGYVVKPDGTKSEGLWRDDQLYKGRLYRPDGSFYEGDVMNGRADGNGEYVGVDGTTHQGLWKEDKKEGWGKTTFADKTVYEGNFQNDEMNGEGKILWPNGNKYEGDFVDSTLNGQGVFTSSEGNILTGKWYENKINGKGVFNWVHSGRKYDGEYIKGKKEGYGIYWISPDTVFRGHWVNDKPQGLGELETKNKIYRGLWRFGKLVNINEEIVKNNSSDNVNENELLNFTVEREGDREPKDISNMKSSGLVREKTPIHKYKPQGGDSSIFNLTVKANPVVHNVNLNQNVANLSQNVQNVKEQYDNTIQNARSGLVSSINQVNQTAQNTSNQVKENATCLNNNVQSNLQENLTKAEGTVNEQANKTKTQLQDGVTNLNNELTNAATDGVTVATAKVDNVKTEFLGQLNTMAGNLPSLETQQKNPQPDPAKAEDADKKPEENKDHALRDGETEIQAKLVADSGNSPLA